MTPLVRRASAWLVLDRARLLSCVLAFSVLPWFAPVAWAATQGSGGPSSTGTVDMHVVLGTAVRISGFSDMSFGAWSGTGDVEANDDLCVGRTGVPLFGSGPYRILASGDGAPGNPSAFTLTNGAHTINYNAYFNDQPGVTNRQQLTPGVALTNQSAFGFWMVFNYLFGCVTNNANVSVIVPASELGTGAGTYTGTLTLMMIPE